MWGFVSQFLRLFLNDSSSWLPEFKMTSSVLVNIIYLYRTMRCCQNPPSRMLYPGHVVSWVSWAGVGGSSALSCVSLRTCFMWVPCGCMTRDMELALDALQCSAVPEDSCPDEFPSERRRPVTRCSVPPPLWHFPVLIHMPCKVSIDGSIFLKHVWHLLSLHYRIPMSPNNKVLLNAVDWRICCLSCLW